MLHLLQFRRIILYFNISTAINLLTGTPINRLPIMAKSVLDLYELYNLVIARGGLVEVINKKLWQEIIKGLRLPSSITSAAFTLRTQYMKYLYDYECEKNNISTRAELDAAIESNKREGRRSSGPFEASTSAMALMGRPQAVPLPMDQMPLQFQPYAMPSIAGVTGQHMPQPNQSQLTDMIRRYQFEAIRSATGIANQLQEHEAESPSSTSIVSPSQALAVALNAIETGSFFNFIHHRYNRTSVDLEPQREALNLSESPVSTGSGARRRSRSPAAADTPPPTAKRSRTEATGAVAGPVAGPSPAPVAGPSSAPVAGPSSAPVAGPSSAPHRAVINSSENPNDTEESDASPPNRFLVANGYEGRRISFSLNDDATNSEVSVSLRINGVTFNGTLSRSPKGPNGLRQERP
ncbi:unnamed protein product [Euphydryas editha]|uniref:ARID domain-containing protein n=1 Tax=Euphydryas editha TaxID=104508 RepID=A0AAU9TRN2_EUPED|nr:unnamed protein product [Euphydryas editha]